MHYVNLVNCLLVLKNMAALQLRDFFLTVKSRKELTQNVW